MTEQIETNMQNRKRPPQQVPFTCGDTSQTHNQFDKSNAIQISFRNMHITVTGDGNCTSIKLSRFGPGFNEDITISVTPTAILISQPLHSCTTQFNLPSATINPALSPSSLAADSNAQQMDSNISIQNKDTYQASRPLYALSITSTDGTLQTFCDSQRHLLMAPLVLPHLHKPRQMVI